MASPFKSTAEIFIFAVGVFLSILIWPAFSALENCHGRARVFGPLPNTFGMHDPLWNTLPVEVSDLLDELEVLKKGRATVADCERVIVVFIG